MGLIFEVKMNDLMFLKNLWDSLYSFCVNFCVDDEFIDEFESKTFFFDRVFLIDKNLNQEGE